MPTVIALLAKGADPNARDWPPYAEFLSDRSWRGRYHSSAPKTALMATLELNVENIVRLLLAGGALVNIKNKVGETPMSLLNVTTDPSTLKMLTQAGAK